MDSNYGVQFLELKRRSEDPIKATGIISLRQNSNEFNIAYEESRNPLE